MNRDITIPDSMQHLPIKGGYPVPYVADWTGEHETNIEYNKELKHFVITTGPGSVGDGEPIFGRQNPPRQRECMMKLRCQVCHTELEHDDAWWFIAGWIPADGKSGGDPIDPHIEEPPLCIPCARFAVTVCPGLNREVEGPYSGLIIYKTYEFDERLQAMQSPDEPSQLVVQFVLAHLTAYTKYTPAEFIEETNV